MDKSALNAIGLAFGLSLLASCGGAQDAPAGQGDAATVEQAAAADPDAAHSKLLAAAEPFEDLTEQAPKASAEKLTELVAAAREAARHVAPGLATSDRVALEAITARIEAARQAEDRTAVALSAVEGYRALVEAAGEVPPIPQAVSLLDYAGFRFNANLAAQPPRWDDAEAALTLADGKWEGLRAQVGDTELAKRFGDSLAAMRAALESKDADAAHAAANRELDLVDELEHYFAKAAG